MSLKSHLLAVAAGVAGATLYQRARESGVLTGAGAGASRFPAGGAASTIVAADDLPGSASDRVDSPNPVERMNAEGLQPGPVSSDAAAGPRLDDDLFGSNAASGSEPRVPGVPDLTRGA